MVDNEHERDFQCNQSSFKYHKKTKIIIRRNSKRKLNTLNTSRSIIDEMSNRVYDYPPNETASDSFDSDSN